MKLQKPRGYPKKTPVFDELVLHPSQWDREHWSYHEDLRTRSKRRRGKPITTESAIAEVMKLLGQIAGG